MEILCAKCLEDTVVHHEPTMQSYADHLHNEHLSHIAYYDSDSGIIVIESNDAANSQPVIKPRSFCGVQL